MHQIKCLMLSTVSRKKKEKPLLPRNITFPIHRQSGWSRVQDHIICQTFSVISFDCSCDENPSNLSESTRRCPLIYNTLLRDYALNIGNPYFYILCLPDSNRFHPFTDNSCFRWHDELPL